MTKTILLIATLIAASTSPVFAQGVKPAQDRTGIIDTLIEQADALRCAVVRDDLPDEMMLSGCASRVALVGRALPLSALVTRFRAPGRAGAADGVYSPNID
jgi:hypothetical protein